MARIVTAPEMARARGVCPKRFRAALRRSKLAWHEERSEWSAREDSLEHLEMLDVLDRLAPRSQTRAALPCRPVKQPRVRADSDEAYVIRLCDKILCEQAFCQWRFDYLRGDPGRKGHKAKLPVDAYYPSKQWVIEYHEVQHDVPNPFMDRRSTISGCGRREQRQRYDDRRREILPTRGLTLVVIKFSVLSHWTNGRLKRTCALDEEKLRKGLCERNGEGILFYPPEERLNQKSKSA